MQITAAGRKVYEATARREANILPELSRGLSLQEIETATRVPEQLKDAFEGERWRRLVLDHGGS